MTLTWWKNYRGISLTLRGLLCALLTCWALQSLLLHGLRPYESYRDYSYRTGDESSIPLGAEVQEVSQDLLIQGNHFNQLQLYFNQPSDALLTLSLTDSAGKTILQREISCGDYAPGAWSPVSGFSAQGLSRGATYTLKISSPAGLDMFSVFPRQSSSVFGPCLQNGEERDQFLALGMQCTYTYLPWSGAAEFGFQALSLLLLCLALCYTIWTFPKLYAVATDSGFQPRSLLPGAYFAVSTVLFFNPLDALRNEVIHFTRTFGQGMVWNVDVSRRTSNFLLWFALFAAALLLFSLLINALFHRNHPEDKRMIRFLDQYMVVAGCALALRCISFFQEASQVTSVFHFTYAAALLVALLGFGYLCAGFSKRITAGDYAKLHLSLAAVSIPVAALLPGEWGEGRLALGVWAILALGANLILLAGKNREARSARGNFLAPAAMLLSAFPLWTSVYIELINVLNQHHVFVGRPARLFLILCVAYGLGALLLSAVWRKQPWPEKYWKKIAYPLLVVGFACLAAQIPLSKEYTPDLMERANEGILISDFLHFRAIPFVEHYGGHMMSSVWEGLLYALVNGDFSGAYMSPYFGLYGILLTWLFYRLVKEAWNEEAAFFSALFFPLTDYWFFSALGMLLCLAVLAYAKKNTFWRAFLVWTAFVWCAFYRLDLGFAFGVAAVATLTTWRIYTKRKGAVKQLAFTLLGWVAFLSFAWCVLCLAKGINPLERFREFMLVSLSNKNWAYDNLGDSGNAFFAWIYVFMPFLIIGGLVYASLSKTFRAEAGERKWLLMLMLGWAYVGNITRGLVRHSLVEEATLVLTWTGYPFLALFFSCFWKKMKLFLPILLGCTLLTMQLLGENLIELRSVAERAMTEPQQMIESWRLGRFAAEEGETETAWQRMQREQEVAQRVQLDPETAQAVEMYAGVLETLLEPGETFVDFVNKSLLYSIMERKDPLYVTQSPLQLSGEYTQRQFIRQMEGIPLVVMPLQYYPFAVTLDDLPNVYRNYLVSEYLYQHYEPLCSYGEEYALWALKERKEGYIDLLTAAYGADSPVKIIDYGYDSPIGMYHSYTLAHLPRLWAEKGDKALQNPVQAELENRQGIYLFDPKTVDPGQGNYLHLQADFECWDAAGNYGAEDEAASAVVSLGRYGEETFEPLCQYVVTMKEGAHDYLIRCSADYYWYTGEINAVKVDCVGILNGLKMEILAGD